MKNLSNNKTLVSGGAGFIGSHLVEELVSTCDEVIVVDDFSNGRMENLEKVKDKIEVIKGDISISFPEFKELLRGHKFDDIFHLACHPRSLSLINPFRDLEVNAKGTLNILEFARENNCKVVFTSNSGIYGESEYLPMDERHPDNPTTPYDANKLVAEYYMKIYHKIYDLPIALCRLATVYGERQRAKPDWKPVIAEFTQNFLEDKVSTIFWDGEQTRDLINVKDVIRGLIKASNSDTKDELFILGTNTETSINEIYEIVCKAFGKKKEPRREKKAAGDIRRMRYSYDKAKEYLNFEPKITINEGIKRYVDWLQATRKC